MPLESLLVSPRLQLSPYEERQQDYTYIRLVLDFGCFKGGHIYFLHTSNYWDERAVD